MINRDQQAVGQSMQQVADWLAKLNLEQYAQRFAENDISFSVLPDLTDQDLKEIGCRLVIDASCCEPYELPNREKEAPKPVVAENLC